MMHPHRGRVFANVIVLVVGLGLCTYLIKQAWTSWNPLQRSRSAVSSDPNGERVQKVEAQKDEAQILEAAQLKDILKRRQGHVMVLDIQERGRFKKGHIPSAINIPSDELEARSEDELSKSDLIIIVDCACDGTNTVSLMTRSALVNLGFPNVAILDDGLNAWKRASFEIVVEKE